MAKQVFVPNHLYEDACHLYFHSLEKSGHFHVKCFARAFVLKRGQGKKQLRSLRMRQVVHQVGTYSGFCSITRSISTTPPPPAPQWDDTPSQGYMYLTVLNFPVLIYPPEWKEVVRVKCLAQEHNTVLPARAQGQTAQSRKEIPYNFQNE